MKFEEVSKDIFKMNIPFEDGFTSVFVLVNDGRCFLLDAAATDDDSRDYIIPALNNHGFSPDYIVCSHLHPDHFGGIQLLADTFYDAKISVLDKSYKLGNKEIFYLTDGDVLLGRYKILSLKGHTGDSIGILDLTYGILLTADALQLYGSGRYGTGLELPGEYIKTLENVKKLNLSGLIASHEYEPLGSTAFGADEINKYINTCRDALDLIVKTVNDNPSAAPAKIAEFYNNAYPTLPTISDWTAENVLRDLF